MHIRWLLAVGALVTVVSLVRLVAGQWQLLPAAWQFLLLCCGSAMVYGVGEIALRRLQLPKAAGALMGLFSLSVPVLAWGAGRQGLLDDSAGLVAFAAGLGLWILTLRRLMGVVYDYRSVVLPIGLGLMSALVPALQSGAVDSSYAVPGAGLALLGLCRHVNRFFFHRDRLLGVERPVDFLPFAALLALFSAAVLAGPVGPSELAVALLFVGWALAATGEEYVRALHRIGRFTDGPWPARSRGLLSLGSAAAVASIGLAWTTGDATTFCWTTGAVALQTLIWSLRYGSAKIYSVALPCALVALHSLPAAFADLKTWAVELASAHFGIDGVGGAVSAAALGEASLLLMLTLGAAVLKLSRLRERFTPAMASVHAAALAVLGLWTLVVTAVGVSVMAQVAPVVAAATALGAWLLRRTSPLITTHAASTVAAYAWCFHALEPAAALIAVSSAASVLSALGLRLLSSRHWTGDLDICFVSPILITAGAALAGFGRVFMLQDPEPAVLAPVALLFGLAAWPVYQLGCRRRSQLLALPAIAWALPSAFAALTLWNPDLAAELFLVIGCALLLVVWPMIRRFGNRTDQRTRFYGDHLKLVWVLTGALGLTATVAEFGTAELAVQVALFLTLLGGSALDFSWHLRGEHPPGGFELGRRAQAMRRFGCLSISAALVALVAPLLSFAGVVFAWLVVALGLRYAATSPRWVYRLERLRTAWYPEVADLGADMRLATRQALRTVIRAQIAVAFAFTGPWIWGGLLVVAGILWTERPGARSAAPAGSPQPTVPLSAAGLGLLILGHFTLGFVGDGFWPALLVSEGGSDGAAARFLLVVAAWLWTFQGIDGRVSGHPRKGLLLEWTAFAVVLGTSLVGAVEVTAVSCAVTALAARHLHRAWQEDLPRPAVFGLLWLGLLGLRFHELAGLEIHLLTVAYVAVASGWLLRVAAEAMAHHDRPRLGRMAHVLVGPTMTSGALAGLWASGPAPAAALPALAASLYFALSARRDNGELWTTAGASALLFVAGFTRLLAGQTFFGPEIFLVGPGTALLGLALLLPARLGAEWTRHLVTLGAGCLYAVPTMALLRQTDWTAQLALLLLAVGFGAWSFHLRSRSLLVVSTGAVLVDLGFFLLMVGRTEPVLLWVLGLGFGLGLMAVAALLERRREDSFQQVRVWGRSLRTWS